VCERGRIGGGLAVTTAVCLGCGQLKHGSLNPCSECGHSPGTDEEKAKSVILSDHHFSLHELKVLAGKIKNGETVEYSEDLMEAYLQTFAENPNIETSAALYVLLFLLVFTVLIVVVVWGLRIFSV
jgi:hypothetical protein